MLTREQLNLIGNFIVQYKKLADDDLIPSEGSARRTELDNVVNRLYSTVDNRMKKETEFEQQIKDYNILLYYLLQVNLDKVEQYIPETTAAMRDIIKEASASYDLITRIPFVEGRNIKGMVSSVYEDYDDERFRSGLQTTLSENKFFSYGDIFKDIAKCNKSIWGKPSQQWKDMELAFTELTVLGGDVEMALLDDSPENIQAAIEEYTKKLQETIEKTKAYSEYKADQFEKKNRKPKNKEILRIATAKKIQAYAEMKLEELAALKERAFAQLGKTDTAVIAERDTKKLMEDLKDLDDPNKASSMETQPYFSKMQDNLKVIKDVERMRGEISQLHEYFNDTSEDMHFFTRSVSARQQVLHVQKSLIYGLSGLTDDSNVVRDCLNFIIKGEISNPLKALDDKLEKQLEKAFPNGEGRLQALESLQNIAFENFAKVFSSMDALDANTYGAMVRLTDFFFPENSELARELNGLSEDNQKIFKGLCCVGTIAKKGIEAWDALTNPKIENSPAYYEDSLADYLSMRVIEMECKRFKSLRAGEINPIFKDFGTGDSEKNLEKLTAAIKNTEVFKQLNKPGEVKITLFMNAQSSKIDEILSDMVDNLVGKDYIKAPKAPKTHENLMALSEEEKTGPIKALPDEHNAGMSI